jgi:uncharacterized protein
MFSLKVLLLSLALMAMLSMLACSDDKASSPQQPTVPTLSGNPLNVGLPQMDNITLRGHLFAPDNEPVVILAHEWQDDQSSWFDFAQVLVDAGYAVFTFDFRGHGETEGETNAGLLDEDLRAAIAYVQSLGKERVYLVGASMGGTTSLVVAQEGDVVAVVGLSPPAQFEDQDALAAVPLVTAPKLLIASEGDAPSLMFDDLVEAAAPPKDVQMYPGIAHGTALLCQPECPDDESEVVAQEVETRVLRFLSEESAN